MLAWLRHSVRQSARKLVVAGGLGLLTVGIVTPLTAFAYASTTTCTATDTACVIAFGDARIAERESALSKLNSKVSAAFADQRISSGDNSTLVGDISTNETGLTTLKGQLDSATDAKTARADVKLIYTQFRIFAVVLPRDYHELWLDMLTHTDTRLQGSETLLKDAIAGAPAGVQGQANTLFSDYQTQVSTAQAQTDAAQNIIGSLTPAGFDASPTSYATQFSSYKSDIATAAKSTRQAASDMHQILALLKSGGAH